MVASVFDRPSSLPWPRTSLIGRTDEVAVARALLVDENVPLLTLTGTGGVGKTRLALEIAAQVVGDFADGVVFVDLTPIRNPTQALPAIAQAIGLREASDRALSMVIAAALRSRQILLLLDNCEQVLAAVPEVGALLANAPALQILATSRAPLHLRGEYLLPVEPLALPASEPATPAALLQIEAVALFLARARAADARFRLTEANAEAVAAICRQLDGLPLALELAAARLRLLTPQALLALLSDRLRVLTGGARDVPERQRTIRDTIAWSYNLLGTEAALFRRLGIFVGGFDLAAAAAVAGREVAATVEDLEALLDQSLVRRAERGGGDHTQGVPGAPRSPVGMGRISPTSYSRRRRPCMTYQPLRGLACSISNPTTPTSAPPWAGSSPTTRSGTCG